MGRRHRHSRKVFSPAQTNRTKCTNGAHGREPYSLEKDSLIEALFAADYDNLSLSSENSHLVQQINELKKENIKLVSKTSILNKTLDGKIHLANEIFADLMTALKAIEASQDENKMRKENILQMDNESSSLREYLHAQKLEREKEIGFWMKELVKKKSAFDKQLKTFRAECKPQQDFDLQQIQAECRRKVTQFKEQITDKDKVISNLRDEMTEEHINASPQFAIKQTKLDQRMNNYNALGEQVGLNGREESWEIRKKEMEKLWLEKEDTLMKIVSKAEEELKLVILQNIQLQERILKKEKQGFWGKKMQKGSIEVEEAAGHSARAGQVEKKEEEATGSSAQAEQGEEKEREKRETRGFWNWIHKKISSNSDRRLEEGAACQEAGQW